MKIPVYDATQKADIDRAATDIEAALAAVQQSADTVVAPIPDIVPNDDLIGISDEVYQQINAALKSGKKHLMFYGAPGTGKTQLAIDVASQLADEHALVTGSADWTSQDLIGGYMPTGGNKISFQSGLLLQNFDKPFIIDELNRCDIDKVIGPLFTVLSGAPSTLPYLIDPEDANSLRFVILPEYNPNKKEHEFSPTPYWRILATINSIDKASLYQMSYALMRRFAWILVDVPTDLRGFIIEFVLRNNLGHPAANAPVPLAEVWAAINAERKIGPAAIIDLLRFCRTYRDDFDFSTVLSNAEAHIYVSALSAFVFPMLDGITRAQAERLVDRIASALGIASGADLENTLKSRLAEVSI